MAIKTNSLLFQVITIHMIVLPVAKGSSENIFLSLDENNKIGSFFPIESKALMTGKIRSLSVKSSIDCAFACLETPQCVSYNFAKTERVGTFICEPLKTNFSSANLSSMSTSTYFYTYKTVHEDAATVQKRNISFTHQGNTGRTGPIQEIVVNKTGNYIIAAGGARGGTLSCNYGTHPGTYLGGKGATMRGTFLLNAGTVLKIVVGQRGGDAVEVKGGQATTQTAASLGLSVEDNAGTGGGGGTFIYTSGNTLLLAAGGGGGAAYHSPGVNGQITEAGSPCSKEGVFDSIYKGGTGGQAGLCNSASGNYHGGVGAGWNGLGCTRKGVQHGERGGSRLENWFGGRAGKMNSGNNGGPVPGAVGGFGGGGGGSEDNGASGGGGGYSGGGSGIRSRQAGGGGGSFCAGTSCKGVIGGNPSDYGFVNITDCTIQIC